MIGCFEGTYKTLGPATYDLIVISSEVNQYN